MYISLDERLGAVAGFVRVGAVLADVGTDHAYLPIWLVQNKKIERAVITEINTDPYLRAMENISRYGLKDKISCLLSDGLNGICDTEVTDITICGMGGRLICDIIKAAKFICRPGTRLILQPMTHHSKVREYILSLGFDIKDERITESEGKLYVCICADYDGAVQKYSDIELELGRCNINNRSDLFYRLLEKKIKNEKKKIYGQMASGRQTGDMEQKLNTYQILYDKRNENI